jgi:manganese-dependent ADP-ribose/CDP-alcohol diphosphatase
MEKAAAHLRRVPCPCCNLIGNHELYNFDRARLAQLLNTRPPPAARDYYSVRPVPGWRILVLDAYHESVIGYPEDHPNFQRAADLLCTNNPNDWRKPGDFFAGMEGNARRFVPFNGGLGEEQLRWIFSELTEATMAEERVVLLSHCILHPEACD